MTAGGSDIFYGGIRVFRGFDRLMDPVLYVPLPDDWTIGVADIVESTKAIAAQRYKAVNVAGAAVIAAVTNALEGREFPFVFGGDARDRALERLLAQQNRGEITKPILEINLRHPLVAAISTEKDAAKDLSLLLLEQAQILEGELPEDPAAFAGRLNALVLRGLAKG